MRSCRNRRKEGVAWLLVFAVLLAVGCQRPQHDAGQLVDAERQATSAVVPDAAAPGGSWTEVLKNEPTRPKAETPVEFGHSYAAALEQAQRSGRRVLAYFTGDGCLWCRVLEDRTFTDAEVAKLSLQYVCVEVRNDSDLHARLWDTLRVMGIPHSIILESDGRPIDRRIGYLAPTEYAAWLRDSLTTDAQEDELRVHVPAELAPVGATSEEADVVFWFVDCQRLLRPDDPAPRHAELLALIEGAGLKARFEYLELGDFPDRWDRAARDALLPDVIVAFNYRPILQRLEHEGRLRAVGSERLRSRGYFARSFVWLVPESPRSATALRAVQALLPPPPGSLVEGIIWAEPPRKAEAILVASQTVEAYLSCDVARLPRFVSSRSFLSQCQTPPGKNSDFAGMQATVSSTETRGNAHIALAIAETQCENSRAWIQSSVLTILVNETDNWRVLSIASGEKTKASAAALAKLSFDDTRGAVEPRRARLLLPADGAPIDEQGFVWELEADGAAPIAQVAEFVFSGVGAAGWLDACSLTVIPGDVPPRSLPFDTIGESSRWRVWTIAPNGRIAISNFRSYSEPVLPKIE